jgi:hypothetical protein
MGIRWWAHTGAVRVSGVWSWLAAEEHWIKDPELFVFLVLWIEKRALHMLGKCSTTELHLLPQPSSIFGVSKLSVAPS